jgi:hypothetical protein
VTENATQGIREQGSKMKKRVVGVRPVFTLMHKKQPRHRARRTLRVLAASVIRKDVVRFAG